VSWVLRLAGRRLQAAFPVVLALAFSGVSLLNQVSDYSSTTTQQLEE
jgi:hypothetical protein